MTNNLETPKKNFEVPPEVRLMIAEIYKNMPAYEAMVDFVNKLKRKYGEDEVVKYRMFHEISGSTPLENRLEHFDFILEDSIEQWLRNKHQELNG